MDGLPPGWSAKFDHRMNRWYYINHAAKTTQWEKPQIQTQPVVSTPSEHRVQFNPTQKSTAELRDERVDQIIDEFLPDSRYDDEMRTLIRELLVSNGDDKASVVDQIKSLGIGQQADEDYSSTESSDDEYKEQQRLAAEQAAREELEAEQAAREAELAAQRQAEEEQERKEELERKKRREEYKRKEKEKREKEVREKRQREIERENRKREKELAAEKRQNEERMKREQVITNQATKPQEQKKTKAPIKVNFASKLAKGSAGLANGPAPRIKEKSCAKGPNRSLAKGPNPELVIGATIMAR